MARRKATHNKSDIRQAWDFMIKMGKTPVSITFKPDGSFRIITTDHLLAVHGPPPGNSGQVNVWDTVLK